MSASRRLDDLERGLIEDAISEGKVTRIETKRRRDPVPEPVDWPSRGTPQRSKAPPERPQMQREMSIRRALEWAFADECASMDADELGASTGGQRRSRGVEALIAERAQLGSVSIDTSPGRSWPADEAEIIASVLRNTLPWGFAVWMADLARARAAPKLLEDRRPSLQPVSWVHGRGGHRGRKVDLNTPGVAENLGLPRFGGGQEAWAKRRNRKGVIVHQEVEFTPCRWSPTADQIAAARRDYLRWWGFLLELRAALGGQVGRITITSAMPQVEPWRAGK